jgi:hypothetical protein
MIGTANSLFGPVWRDRNQCWSMYGGDIMTYYAFATLRLFEYNVRR